MTVALRIAGRPSDDELAAVIAALAARTGSAPLPRLAAWRARRLRAVARTTGRTILPTSQHTT